LFLYFNTKRMEELTREHLFNGNELDIDKVADMIQQEP
jgi:hypothetical protein